MTSTEREQLQNCVDWNIRMRDSHKKSDPPQARHYQQNIDALNRRLAAQSL